MIMEETRLGMRLLTDPEVDRINMDAIVKRLDICSKFHKDWETCPDQVRCVALFERRCGIDDTTCTMCGAEVPVHKLCSECGWPLGKKPLKLAIKRSMLVSTLGLLLRNKKKEVTNGKGL